MKFTAPQVYSLTLRALHRQRVGQRNANDLAVFGEVGQLILRFISIAFRDVVNIANDRNHQLVGLQIFLRQQRSTVFSFFRLSIRLELTGTISETVEYNQESGYELFHDLSFFIAYTIIKPSNARINRARTQHSSPLSSQ